MSVPKSKRKVAEFEFYATALKSRTQITEWLMRDFGTKNRFRDVSLVARKARMTDADKTALADLFERYGLGDTVCETYPEWWIAERRRKIDGLLSDAIECIVRAFNLYATTLEEYNERRGRHYLNRSLGIGSQVSQIIGIYYPTPIDFFCKVKKRCRYYGRYMDDIYILHENKEFLAEVLEGVKKIAEELRLFISDKKTRITLSHGFKFLKVRYNVLPSGKILQRLTRDAFIRERRRLNTYRRLLDVGRITRLDARNFYQSYRGQAKHFATHRSLRNLDALYTELFVNS